MHPEGHLGAYLRSSGSFGFVEFIRASPSGCRVHSLGSFGRALVVVGSRLRSFMIGLGAVGFIWVRLVHSGTPWLSLGSFGRTLRVVRFIRANPGCRRGHSGSFEHAVGDVVFIRVCVQFNRVCPGYGRVHSRSLGSFGRSLVFILVPSGTSRLRSGSFGCALGNVGFFRIIRGPPGGSRGHLDSLC